MKKPTKLKPRTLDITFCERDTRGLCATCARNISRYAISKTFLVSVFAEPPCDFASSECAYYIEDARKPEE